MSFNARNIDLYRKRSSVLQMGTFFHCRFCHRKHLRQYTTLTIVIFVVVCTNKTSPQPPNYFLYKYTWFVGPRAFPSIVYSIVYGRIIYSYKNVCIYKWD